MNNGILVQDVYGKIGFEERLPKSLSGPPSVVNMPYHYPPANNWKNNTQQYLILVYDTTKQNNTTISIPYGVTNFIIDINIDWGDGTTDKIIWGDSGNSRSAFHTYSCHGVYTVIISGRLGRLGRANPISIPSLIKCYSFGNLGLTNISGFATSLNLIEAPAILPSIVTDIASLFVGCTIFNDEKIKYWDTTNVTRMNATFLGATIFNQDLGSWNTSNVTITQSMFERATSFNNGNSDSINNWNVSNVTNMSNMFNAATSFNQNLSSWSVRKVTNFSYMFAGAANFNGSLSGWQLGADATSTACLYMFLNASKFNQSLDDWDVSKVNDMRFMFQGAASFNNAGSSGINNWNTSSLITMQQMFATAGNFNQPIGNWNVSGVTNMYYTFGFANSFNQPLINWNTSNVNIMYQMFYSATNFNQPLDNWNVRKVTDFSSMFQSATNFNSSLSGWAPGADTAGTTCSRMFQEATNFVGSGLGSWNVSKVQNMSNMFNSSNAFQTSISGWNLAGLNASTSLDNFMLNKTGANTYSTTNYDALLIGWNNNKASGVNGVADWRTDLKPNFGGAKYTNGGAAAAARAALVSYGWTITDGGSV